MVQDTVIQIAAKELNMYQRILVPVDGSDTSRQALAAALQLARERRGDLAARQLLCIDRGKQRPRAGRAGEKRAQGIALFRRA